MHFFLIIFFFHLFVCLWSADLGAFGSAVVTEKIAARAAAAAAAAAAAKKKKPEVTAAHLEAFLDRMPSGLKKFFIKDRRLAALAIFTRTLAEDKDIPVSVELLENAAAAAIFGGTLSEEAKKEVREAVIKDASKFLDWKKSIYMREALQTDTQSIDKAIQSKPKFRFQGFGTGPDKEIVYLGGGGRRPAPAIGGGGWYKYY